MKIMVRIYSDCKYKENVGVKDEIIYDNVSGFEVKTIDKDDPVVEGNRIDEYNEYVIIHFTDGSEATFRNSHVNLFSLSYIDRRSK